MTAQRLLSNQRTIRCSQKRTQSITSANGAEVDTVEALGHPCDRFTIGVAEAQARYVNVEASHRFHLRHRIGHITPVLALRLGPGVSLYCRDPDGNRTQFPLRLLSSAEATASTASDALGHHPIGQPFDADEAIRRLEVEPVEDLVFRTDQLPTAVRVEDRPEDWDFCG